MIEIKNKKVKIIKPVSSWVPLNIKELWDYRDLLYFMVWKDFIIRYKQTLIGCSWAVLQPFLTMVVFSFFFGKLVGIPSNGVPYPIFSYSGLVPWTFFSVCFLQVSSCLASQTDLIKKVYFPRLILPFSIVLSNILNFLINFVLLLAMMLYFKIIPTVSIIFLPFLLILAIITALGVGLWFSVINVRFRDIERTLPFIIQLWLFMTPVIYPVNLLKEPLKTIYSINPMVCVVEGFRWALLGSDAISGYILLISSFYSICILISGAYFFRRMEKTFADIL